jgi:Spy/CpxP family protein refolding chaperone
MLQANRPHSRLYRVTRLYARSPCARARRAGTPRAADHPRNACLNNLSKELNLTDDQKAKIKPILGNEAAQMKALREDTSLSREDRRAKFSDIQKKASDDIKAVLNPDQQKKYDDMQARMRERREQGQRPPQSQ